MSIPGIGGKHENLEDEICTYCQKTVSSSIFFDQFSSPWHVIFLFNVLINVNLQSTYLLEWNSLVLPRFQSFLPSRMCTRVYGPRPPQRQFHNLVPCSPKQPISIELTLSGQRIGYYLLTVKSFCLLNKYLSSYGGMFIKTKSMSIKTKAIWQRLPSLLVFFLVLFPQFFLAQSLCGGEYHSCRRRW